MIAAIRKELEKKGMSQTDLGYLVDLERREVNMALSRKTRPVSFQRLLVLANALGLEVKVKIRKTT